MTREGTFVFSVYSTKDLILGKGNASIAAKTALFPTVDGYVAFDSFEYSHTKIQDLTIEMQYELVTDHKVKGNQQSFYRNHSSGKAEETTKKDL